MPSPSSSGLSRRALFGLGVSRLGERLGEVPPASGAPSGRRSPGTSAARARWLAADRAADASVWAAAAEVVVDQAAITAGEAVLAHGPTAPAAGARGVAVTAFDGDLAEPPEEPDAFDALVSTFGMQRTPAGFAALAGMFARVRPGGRVSFSAWSGGAVLHLLREAGRVDPLPDDLPAASTWGRDERLRQDLDRYAARDVVYLPGALTVRATSPDRALDRLVGSVPALGTAVARRGDTARDAFRLVLEPHLRRDADGVAVKVPYLVVTARRRDRR